MSDAEWEVLRADAVEVVAQIRLASGRPAEHSLRSMLDAVRYVVGNGIHTHVYLDGVTSLRGFDDDELILTVLFSYNQNHVGEGEDDSRAGNGHRRDKQRHGSRSAFDKAELITLALRL